VPVSEVVVAPIRKALLIAGLSGCGKSTFLKQLRFGRFGGLPEDIKAELPPGCESWKKTHWRSFNSFFETRPSSDRVDVMIHYDLMKGHDAGWSSFFQDPRLHVIAQADMVVAVTFRPSPDQLLAQYARKLYGGETRAQTRRAARRAKLSENSSRVLGYLAKRANLLRPNGRFLQRKNHPMSRPNAVVALYRQPDWL
jgi:hypothetical protein